MCYRGVGGRDIDYATAGYGVAIEVWEGGILTMLLLAMGVL